MFMVKMGEKITTGIGGLDIILKGGLRAGSSVLVTGPPGTGKTYPGEMASLLERPAFRMVWHDVA